MICSYCKTETKDTDTKTCDFCKADLTAPRPKLNPYLSELEAERTQPQLSKMHTYDLMLILTHIRAERTSMYKTCKASEKLLMKLKTVITRK